MRPMTVQGLTRARRWPDYTAVRGDRRVKISRPLSLTVVGALAAGMLPMLLAGARRGRHRDPGGLRALRPRVTERAAAAGRTQRATFDSAVVDPSGRPRPRQVPSAPRAADGATRSSPAASATSWPPDSRRGRRRPRPRTPGLSGEHPSPAAVHGDLHVRRRPPRLAAPTDGLVMGVSARPRRRPRHGPGPRSTTRSTVGKVTVPVGGPGDRVRRPARHQATRPRRSTVGAQRFTVTING